MVDRSLVERATEAARAVGRAASSATDTVVGTAAAATGAGMTADQEKIVQKAGLSGGAIPYFDKKSEQYSLLNQTFKGLEKDMANNPKYDTFLRQLGTRFGKEATANKNDISKPTVMDAIAADIGQNKDMAKRLEAAIRKNPDAVAAKIQGYKTGQLASVLAEVEGVAPSPIAAATPSSTAPPTPTQQPTAAPARTTTRPAGVATTAAPAPAKTAPVAAPATPPMAAEPPAANAPAGARVDPMQSIIDSFTTSDNELLTNNVQNTMNGAVVAHIAQTMSNEAITKFGVEKPAAEAFAQKIKTNPQLAKQIEDNFKRNPDFVRELALASKSQGQPPAALKEAGKKIMTEVMANPEKLADDGYVKDLSKKMKMGREAEENGMGAAFSGLFDKLKSGDFKGFFSQIGDMIMGLINKFTGGGSGVSMSNNGSFMNSMSNFFAGLGFGNNMNGIGRLSPSDMTAYPPGGQKFVEKVTKNPDGTERKEMVANTVQVPTTVVKNNGTIEVEMMALVPAVGEGIIAKQLAGVYGKDGKYQQGLWSVPVVTGYNSKGDNIIKEAQMTTEQFTAYQAMIKEASKNDPRFPNGTGRTLVAEGYTERDAMAARQRELQDRPVRTVDRSNGQVGEEMAMSDLPRVGGLRQPVAGQPVQPNVAARRDPTNDPRYTLDGTTG